MKKKLVLNDFILVSGYKAEDVTKVEKFAPEVLEQKNQDGDVVFYYGTGHTPSLTSFSCVFNETTDEGYLALRIPLPQGLNADEKKQYVAEHFGKGIEEAELIEEMLGEVISNIDYTINELKGQIEVGI